jgi:hypothetical protein
MSSLKSLRPLLRTLTVALATTPGLLTPAAAQTPPRYALTEGRLTQALAEVREDRAPVVADVLTMRVQRGDLRTPSGNGVFFSVRDYLNWREKYPPPFNVIVASPYMRVLFTASDAKRRYLDPPPMGAAALNVDGIVVSVIPSEDFARADAIDDVVLKRFDGETIHAARRDVREVTIQNRQGASRTVSDGAFYFKLEDFEQMPVTIICIGRSGNFEIVLNIDDINY